MIQTPDVAGEGPDPCDCRRTDVCDNIDMIGDRGMRMNIV